MRSIILDDTIVAISTPPGEGAIGVIRLSGKEAIAIANTFFKGKNLKKVDANTLHFGRIVEKDKIIDEVVAAVFHGPKSYTGEDVVEVSCHGSPYILQKVVQLYIQGGARTANRGEFTLRAFLNGKMDLSQAEAVADLIASDTEQSHHFAMEQMRKGFSDTITSLRQELIDFAALIELELDFGEEDVEFADRERLRNLVMQIRSVIQDLKDSFTLGNVIRNGVTTVIAGRPNAGKSTLLNAMLNEERAIVSEIAGTTRDTIEEVLNIKGINFRIIDTAGIREAHDQIEQIGVERTFEKIRQSTILVYVFDAFICSPEVLQNDLKFIIDENTLDIDHIVCVGNKMDKVGEEALSKFIDQNFIKPSSIIGISALNKTNIESLNQKLYDMVIEDSSMLDKTIVTNIRHHEALQSASSSLEAVIDGLGSGITGDFIAMDIRNALYHLGQITGEVSNDELLDSIFGRFCIGK